MREEYCGHVTTTTNHSSPGGHGAGPAEPHADDAHGDVGGGVQRRRDGREEHRGHPHVDAGEEHGHVSRVTCHVSRSGDMSPA